MNSDHELSHDAAVLRVFQQLDKLGVREYVICAGARNAALIEVADARCTLHQEFRLFRFVDERAAAFFALGRMLASERPVAVFTTSGTAVAELYPAVIEAYYQGLRLVLVSADRPLHFADSGAPQAMVQTGLFAGYAQTDIHADARMPLHLNVPLEERSVARETLQTLLEIGEPDQQQKDQDIVLDDAWHQFWQSPEPLLVVAAGLTPNQVRDIAPYLCRIEALMVVEATSNFAGCEALKGRWLQGSELLLQSLNAKRVLRIGAVPSWRWWRDLEAMDDVQVLSLSLANKRGLGRQQGVWSYGWHYYQALPSLAQKSVQHSELKSAAPAELSEAFWGKALSQQIPQKALCMIGNSMSLRLWNQHADWIRILGPTYANRGVNGIDGLIATWLGLSVDAEESWILLGDLSAIYDSNALWIVDQLPKAKRRIVVMNNAGGQIFSQVKWLMDFPDGAKKAMLNAHQWRFYHWAKMWNAEYQCLTDSSQYFNHDASLVVYEVLPER